MKPWKSARLEILTHHPADYYQLMQPWKLVILEWGRSTEYKSQGKR